MSYNLVVRAILSGSVPRAEAIGDIGNERRP
jgi:hypothetical protein